jgi:hypothetical protein
MTPSSICVGRGVAVALQIGPLALGERLGAGELVHRGHHGEHDLQPASGRGLQEGADLAAEKARPVEADADRPPAERRVLFLHRPHIGQDLVAADVEGAEGDGGGPGRVEHGAVELLLLGRGGHALRDHELDLGAKQPDAGGAGFLQVRQVDEEARIELERDLDPVPGDRRHVAQAAVLLLPAGAQPRLFGVSRLHVGAGAHLHLARAAVDDDGIARLHEGGGVLDLAHGRDAERTGHDGDVARGAGLLQHEAAQARAVVIEERRRAHGAGHDDGILGQKRALGHHVAADERMEQAVREVVEVVQALAEVWVRLAQHAGAVVGLHPLDAASAVRPESTASRMRRSQPWSWANIRKVSSTSRCSP